MYKALDLYSLNINVPLLEGIALAARHGYQGITIDPDSVQAIGVEAVRESMVQHNIVNAGTGLPWNYMDDESWFDKTLVRWRSKAKTARAVGCTRAFTGVMSSADVPYNEQYGRVLSRLRPLAQILQDEGIMMGIEFLGPTHIYKSRKYGFIRTLPELMRFADSIDAWNCGVLLDSHHCHTAGHSMDIIETITANRIGFVHISDQISGVPYDELRDSPRLLPGETGVIDNKGLLKRLFHMGYEGPVVVEPFYEPFKTMPDADEKAALAKAAMDSVWPV